MTLTERILRIEKLLGIVTDDTEVLALPEIYNIDERKQEMR